MDNTPAPAPIALADGRHFKVSEMACHDGTPYPAAWPDRLAELFSMLDTIREAWGGQVEIVSGYRSPAHNKELLERDAETGSHQVASGSEHVEGRAADLRPVSGIADCPRFHDVIMELHLDNKLPQLGGIGLYPKSGWVHVDTFKAPDGHLRQWPGT